MRCCMDVAEDISWIHITMINTIDRGIRGLQVNIMIPQAETRFSMPRTKLRCRNELYENIL